MDGMAGELKEEWLVTNTLMAARSALGRCSRGRGSDAAGMKFTVRAGDLRSALEQVSRAVAKAPNNAVFAGVRLSVREGTLSATASNEGDVTLTKRVAVTGASSGTCVLLPKPLTAFLAGLAPSTLLDVSAQSAGAEMTISPAGASPYTFRLLTATFPVATLPNARTFPADLSNLAAAVQAVKQCAASSKLVQVQAAPDGLRLHATDNLRLARAELRGVDLGTFSGLLPTAVLELLAEHGSSGEAVQIALDKAGRVFAASMDTVTLVARVVDEMFPNVDSVLGDVPVTGAMLPGRDVLRALTRLAVVADSGPVVVSLVGDQMTLTSGSGSSIGTGVEVVELVDPAPSEFTFGVNPTFFRDAIAAHPTTSVKLHWTSARQAIFVTSHDPLPVTTVTMPVGLA